MSVFIEVFVHISAFLFCVKIFQDNASIMRIKYSLICNRYIAPMLANRDLTARKYIGSKIGVSFDLSSCCTTAMDHAVHSIYANCFNTLTLV